MKLLNRILLFLGCVILLSVSWLLAITAKSDAQRQGELIEKADAYIKDGIYINAVELLEEAVAYNTARTFESENMLKDTYLHLLPRSGYASKYADILEKQMSRKDAPPEIFREAADYYLDHSYLSDALSTLRRGIALTGDAALNEYYETLRYAHYQSSDIYQEASEFSNGYSKVKTENGWGLASRTGSKFISCQYDQISAYDNGHVIIREGDIISAIDINRNRTALSHETISDFSDYAQDRLWVKTDAGWRLTNGEFVSSDVFMENAGMFSNGAWGLVALNGANWILPARYDEIIQDELGRAYAQNSVFIRDNQAVSLLVRDEKSGEFQAIPGVYEDARPFTSGWGEITDCWAAVKKDGLWGFIDTAGNTRIECQYEDARSFSGHLAAVKTENGWGYINLRGEIVIDAEYLDAKNFDGGSAPVLTEEGWVFLTLTEYGG